MNSENSNRLETSLESIRQLLTHLNGEVVELEERYSQVMVVLSKLEEATQIDELTGLLRRKAFFKRWEALLDECERLNESCGVLMIDIDHFKRINDGHGHPAGDEVIRRISGMLKQFESTQCFAGRFGGEEFAIAIRGSDSEVLSVAELIRRRAERIAVPTEGGQTLGCTLSVGVASCRQVGYRSSELLAAADKALYVAKSKGRNQVRSAQRKRA